MDVPTVVASAFVSAVISVGVARRVAARQRVAQRADDARQHLRAAVEPTLIVLGQYQAGVRTAERKREAGVLDRGDAALAAAVLAVVPDLPRWRRQLVRRRLERIVGPHWFKVADLRVPPDDRISRTIIALDRATRLPQHPDPPGMSTAGLLHLALCRGPNDPRVKQAKRQVRRLAAGW